MLKNEIYNSVSLIGTFCKLQINYPTTFNIVQYTHSVDIELMALEFGEGRVFLLVVGRIIQVR
jgi:hypothetical protein